MSLVVGYHLGCEGGGRHGDKRECVIWTIAKDGERVGLSNLGHSPLHKLAGCMENDLALDSHCILPWWKKTETKVANRGVPISVLRRASLPSSTQQNTSKRVATRISGFF